MSTMKKIDAAKPDEKGYRLPDKAGLLFCVRRLFGYSLPEHPILFVSL